MPATISTGPELLESVKVAIRQAVAAWHPRSPDQAIAGFALLTDDTLSTLSSLAITEGELRSTSVPDLLFCPTDWTLELSPDAFDKPRKELRRQADASPDLRRHVDSSFQILERALAESRTEGAFGPRVFLSALSTDPSEHLEELENSSIRKLNDPQIVKEHQAFLDRWG